MRALLLVLIAAVTVSAQPVNRTCEGAGCRLTYEPSGFLRLQVIQAQDSSVVASSRYGFIAPMDLAQGVSRVPEAVPYAEAYESRWIWGIALAAGAGAVVGIADLGFASDGVRTGMRIAGAGMLATGFGFTMSSSLNRRRAIRVHNASFPGPPSVQE